MKAGFTTITTLKARLDEQGVLVQMMPGSPLFPLSSGLPPSSGRLQQLEGAPVIFQLTTTPVPLATDAPSCSPAPPASASGVSPATC